MAGSLSISFFIFVQFAVRCRTDSAFMPNLKASIFLKRLRIFYGYMLSIGRIARAGNSWGAFRLVLLLPRGSAG